MTIIHPLIGETNALNRELGAPLRGNVLVA